MKGFNFEFLVSNRVDSFDEEAYFPMDQDSVSVKNKLSLSNLASIATPSPNSTLQKFSRIAQGITSKNRTPRWRQLIEATRNKVMPFSRSQDSAESDGGSTRTANSLVQTSSVTASATPTQPQPKMNANIRRQIYALKLESMSQPVIPNSPVDSGNTNNDSVLHKDSTTDESSTRNTPLSAPPISELATMLMNRNGNQSSPRALSTVATVKPCPFDESTTRNEVKVINNRSDNKSGSCNTLLVSSNNKKDEWI